MKFYIPTSNLNLDNILQSECILPISHYSHRCSGYKTFEQIDELRKQEVKPVRRRTKKVKEVVNEEERSNA